MDAPETPKVFVFNIRLYVGPNRSQDLVPYDLRFQLEDIAKSQTYRIGIQRAGCVFIDTCLPPDDCDIVANFAVITTEDEKEKLVQAVQLELDTLLDNRPDLQAYSLACKEDQNEDPFVHLGDAEFQYILAAIINAEKLFGTNATNGEPLPPERPLPKQ